MQTATQRAFKAPAKKTVRNETLKAINATWRKIAFDLEAEELRDARLAFGTEALGLRHPLKSFGKLSDARLGRILDAMREIERAPGLPGTGFGVPTLVGRPPEGGTPNEGAEIHHLATDPQVAAIGKLFRYLGWSSIGTQAFIAEKYQRTSERMLTPAQANALTMILFNIAGSNAIKKRGFDGKVSRLMIRQEIPRLKRELGIDQKPFTTEDTEEEFYG